MSLSSPTMKFYVRFILQNEYFKGLVGFQNMADVIQALDVMKVEMEAGQQEYVIYEDDFHDGIKEIFMGKFEKHPEGGINCTFHGV